MGKSEREKSGTSLERESQRDISASVWVAMLNIVFLAAMLFVLFRWANWGAFIAAVRGMNPLWFIPVIALQAGTYLCVAYTWHSVLKRFEPVTPLRGLIGLGLVKLFLDQAFPVFGLGGTAIAVRGFMRRGSPTHAALAAAAIYTFTEFILNCIFLIASLAILSAYHVIDPFFSAWHLSIIAAFVIALILGAAYMIRDTRIITALKRMKYIAWLRETAAQIPKSLLSDFSLWVSVSLALAAIWVLDGLTLWALLTALGTHVSVGVVIASSVISSVVSNAVVLPGGFGVFEGSSIALLSLFHVPLEQAIAASILLRGFTYWLPMIPGFFIARREFK